MAKEADKEINFDEALKNAFFTHQSAKLPDNVQEIFDIPKIDDSSEMDPFWLCCSVLKKFYAKENRLPVSGTIPDMTSHTDYYLSLQKVYTDKSVQDLKECSAILEETFKERGVEATKFTEYQE